MVIRHFAFIFTAVLIGILSDTHDRIEPAQAGMGLLAAAGAEFYIHCGDVGGEQILDLFAELPSVLVWGNNDWDRQGLGRYAQALGIAVIHRWRRWNWGESSLPSPMGMMGGWYSNFWYSRGMDYLLLGHSHLRADKRQGRLRIINPGALHRAAEKTVALLDTIKDELRFLRV